MFVIIVPEERNTGTHCSTDVVLREEGGKGRRRGLTEAGNQTSTTHGFWKMAYWCVGAYVPDVYGEPRRQRQLLRKA